MSATQAVKAESQAVISRASTTETQANDRDASPMSATQAVKAESQAVISRASMTETKEK